ncbi:MAG: hypothetical protein KDH97_09230 [Calditrichaeota bacterium]|nr:hypothetical protein [Calditrichota bacterium]
MNFKTTVVILFTVMAGISCSKDSTGLNATDPQRSLELTGTFETWAGGIIMSTDPSGITYHQPSGHLLMTDSEINEIDDIWNCQNVFEISLAGDTVFNTFDVYGAGGAPCPAQNYREPSGITYSAFDGFYYVTDDNQQVIMRFDSNFTAPPLAVVNVLADEATATDPEGVACDPNTGDLYIVSGIDGTNAVAQILHYNANLEFITRYPVGDNITDPEGIAYHPISGHLFILSRLDMAIFEYTRDGAYVQSYAISNFTPQPIRPVGLTFAPASDPGADPTQFNLYIVDTQEDNDENLNERDGLVYEAKIVNR